MTQYVDRQRDRGASGRTEERRRRSNPRFVEGSVSSAPSWRHGLRDSGRPRHSGTDPGGPSCARGGAVMIKRTLSRQEQIARATDPVFALIAEETRLRNLGIDFRQRADMFQHGVHSVDDRPRLSAEAERYEN